MHASLWTVLRRSLFWIGCTLLLSTVPVFAQSTRTVSFAPSPEHSVIAQGVPVVDRYELVLTPSSGPALQPFNLQKPTPTSGSISVNVTTYLNTLPAGTYTAVVTAVGPGGQGVSPVSPSFSLVVPRPGAPGVPSISGGVSPSTPIRN
jgi:hypothetical protein